MKTLNKINFTLFFCATFLLNSCSTEKANQDIQKTTISVKLVDAPGDYEKVFVEVLDVLFKVIDDESVPNSWLSLNVINKGVYNLLDLTGGVEALLVDNLRIPSGMIYEIKLVLGDNNSIVINGNTMPLHMPNEYQKGLIIRDVRFLKPNLSYEFILDFDVDQSILITNMPEYIILKPEIRSSLEAITGSIQGKISLSNIQAEVSLINTSMQISTHVDSDGNFMLKGIPSGNYAIKVTPDLNLDLSEEIIDDIVVKIGKTSEVGIIELKQ